jgi:hypothetical protein
MVGKITSFCIISPNANKIKLKCNCSNLYTIVHENHARLVAQRLNAGDFHSLKLVDMLSQMHKNVQMLSADANLNGEII